MLKESLFKVCGVASQRLVLTEMADSQIRAVLADGKKVKASTALDLMAYELDSYVLENNGQFLRKNYPSSSFYGFFFCICSERLSYAQFSRAPYVPLRSWQSPGGCPEP